MTTEPQDLPIANPMAATGPVRHAATPPTPPQRRLRGAEKAAILFLCLGEERGTELMRKLSPEDIQKITRAVARLGLVKAETVEAVLAEFSAEVDTGGGVVGSIATAEAMLRGFLPEDQVEAILKDIRGPLRERDLWTKFSNMGEVAIAGYLKGEHEQTAAAILGNVSPDVAAKVLPLLGEERMQEVVERMIRMEAVPPKMMQQIEETLQSDMLSAGAQSGEVEMEQRMADLFNKLDRDLFETLQEALETRVPGALEGIKAKMFTFDDLIRLDAQSLARVMRGLQGNTLPLALRGASKEMRAHFLDALTARARDMLLDEMNTMGPVRGRDARAAQTMIVDFTRQLAEDGAIELPSAGDEEEDILE
ncbi:flagellar motor switch protein FliG [Limimaricola pyoseonensis]|uniref:Flagellar motor switch protein FliG n=1 Tax=Limimaricola pyoseonensis TaxID=521013 RepID=A0A1G7KBM3_9RHOB|nr:flagellar motor switch protein FliG [Limimaricola pyoseonensis]SDF34708.1 flagellar motor switch protein FliG [Limimaricola pyoseonensis]